METRDPVQRLREELSRKPLFSERNGYKPLDREPLLELLDEIETRYMRLPVGADGLPIRLGDLLLDVTYNYELYATKMFLGLDGWTINARRPDELRHVKSDTVKSELAEFLSACGDDDPHYYDEQIAEFAERIRKAVEQ